MYSNTVVNGGKRVWWIWSLDYIYSFEALNDAFEVQFLFRVSFLHLIKDTDSCMTFRAMQLRFFKVETLLNNAFNSSLLHA